MIFFTSEAFRSGDLWKIPEWVHSNCHCHQLWSISHDLVDVNLKKLHYSHRWWCFWRWPFKQSPEDAGVNLWQLPLPSTLEHRLPLTPFHHFVEYPQFLMFISPSILLFHILHNTRHQKNTDSDEEAEVNFHHPMRKVIYGDRIFNIYLQDSHNNVIIIMKFFFIPNDICI